jgi:mRNA-degrading endonuclease RelE of RelBE toxin-antitoxin system
MAEPFRIEFSPMALDEINSLRKLDRQTIAASMNEQLRFQPTLLTRNRKPLKEPRASFEFRPPLWEIRCGEFRILYDVDTTERVVYIRAVRQKSAHQTTDEIL